jgi:predicted TIM-barrel fold metal-dependent hydrolase
MVNQSIVVDCDFHVMEPADLWQQYLEPKYRSRAIRIEEKDGVEVLLIGEQPMLEGRLAGLGGVHLPRSTLFSGALKYKDGCPPASYDPMARVKLLDEWQVDTALLLPTICILPFPLDDLELNSAYCRAYNRWQIEFFQTIPDRVVPIAILNWHDLDEAVKELEHCIKAGCRGVFVPPEIIGGQRPGAEHFDPIWAICQEAGIPGCLHVIVRFGGAAVPFMAWHETGPGPLFTFGLGAPGQLIPAITSMVIDGLFDRFTELKIVSIEAGCGYAAYLMDRLDEKHTYFSEFAAQPLAMKPGDYIRKHCYFVAEPEERTIDAMMDLVGEDKIMWGSDFPHIDSTLEAPNQIRESIAGLSVGRQSRVMGTNAAEVFGLS